MLQIAKDNTPENFKKMYLYFIDSVFTLGITLGTIYTMKTKSKEEDFSLQITDLLEYHDENTFIALESHTRKLWGIHMLFAKSKEHKSGFNMSKYYQHFSKTSPFTFTRSLSIKGYLFSVNILE